MFKTLLRATLGPVMLPLLSLYNQRVHPYAVILLYHSISDESNITDPVNISAFRQHMQFLVQNYTVIPLNSIQKALSSFNKGSKPYAIITFDDGYLDNYTNALPILDEFHLPATFFLATSEIGSEANPRLRSQYGIEIPMMDWHHIKQLLARHHLIGSHTESHHTMLTLSEGQRIIELKRSQELIHRNTGVLTELFSLPYGDKYSYTYQDCMQVSKYYRICCNNIRGKNSKKNLDLINLYRYSITGSMCINQFKMELKGCYDILEIFRI